MSDDNPRIHITDKRGRSREEPRDDEAQPETAVPATEEHVAQLDELKRLADDRLDQLMRMKADFENFRKRELREKTEIVDRASLRLVERPLPVIADLERALEAAEDHEGSEAIVKGVELVHRKLHEVLVEEGLERVAVQGPFDPEHHEAVASVPADVDEPTVLEVVRHGYKLKGKTIRPALVQVSVPTESPSPESGGS